MRDIFKNRIWLILLTGILVVGVAIGLAINKEELEKFTQTEPTSSQSQNKSAYQSLDELVKDAMVIVSGTITDYSSLDSTTIEYVFEIERQLKGEGTDKSIHIYESYSDARYTVGEEYVFFLDRWEGGLYPAAVHTSIDEEHPVRIDQGIILHSYSFLEDDLQKRDFFEAIVRKINILRTLD